VGTVVTANATYAFSATNGQTASLGDFGFSLPAEDSEFAPDGTGHSTTVTIEGVTVFLNNAYLSAACTNTKIGVAISVNGGSTWSTVANTGNLTTTATDDYTLGGPTSLWGRTWTPEGTANGAFVVRLTNTKGCATAGLQTRVDQVQVLISYHVTSTVGILR